jgi:hypothetical protein
MVRSIWLELLQRYSKTVFHRRFFLKKPVDYCSARELEEAVTRWWKPCCSLAEGQDEWAGFTIKPPAAKCLRFKGLTPDGSCLLYAAFDGALYYYRVCDPCEPHLLLSPLEHKADIVGTRTTFDYLSMQNIDSTGLPSSDPVFFPSTFNMAVTRHVYDETHASYVEVWAVTSVLHEGRVQGYTCDCLASFYEDDCIFENCSLYGNHIAYGTVNSSMITVVNWAGLSLDSRTYPRVYIPCGRAQVCLQSVRICSRSLAYSPCRR